MYDKWRCVLFGPGFLLGKGLKAVIKIITQKQYHHIQLLLDYLVLYQCSVKHMRWTYKWFVTKNAPLYFVFWFYQLGPDMDDRATAHFLLILHQGGTKIASVDGNLYLTLASVQREAGASVNFLVFSCLPFIQLC